jgi:hypothetical protein
MVNSAGIGRGTTRVRNMTDSGILYALHGADYLLGLAYPWEFNPWEWMRRRACRPANYRRSRGTSRVNAEPAQSWLGSRLDSIRTQSVNVTDVWEKT